MSSTNEVNDRSLAAGPRTLNRQIFMWLVPSAATVKGAEGDAAYADSYVPGFVMRKL